MSTEWNVNAVETEAELKTLRHRLARGTPFGDNHWQTKNRCVPPPSILAATSRQAKETGRVEWQLLRFCFASIETRGDLECKAVPDDRPH